MGLCSSVNLLTCSDPIHRTGRFPSACHPRAPLRVSRICHFLQANPGQPSRPAGLGQLCPKGFPRPTGTWASKEASHRGRWGGPGPASLRARRTAQPEQPSAGQTRCVPVAKARLCGGSVLSRGEPGPFTGRLCSGSGNLPTSSLPPHLDCLLRPPLRAPPSWTLRPYSTGRAPESAS